MSVCFSSSLFVTENARHSIPKPPAAQHPTFDGRFFTNGRFGRDRVGRLAGRRENRDAVEF